jgi:hypothetical protein
VLRVGGDNLRKSVFPEGNIEEQNQKFQQLLKSQDYQPLVDWTVQQLKNKYQEKLVILYIPYIHYNNLNEETSPIETSLKAATKKYNIKFVDPKQGFLKSYQDTHQAAFGFNNTVQGTGHTNEIGHEILAESLASFLKEKIAK